jgi:hypothetical protein
MFDDIWDVLVNPDALIMSPQFRFWVRKMFTLVVPSPTSPAFSAIEDYTITWQAYRFA